MEVPLRNDVYWAFRFIAMESYGDISAAGLASNLLTDFVKNEAKKRGMLLDEFLKMAKERAGLRFRPWNYDL